MGSLLIYGLIAIVFAVALFLLATYFLPAGEQIAQPVRDEPIWALPAGRDLKPDDVETVRLPVALRGYRFAETDLLLDRLAEELKARDAEIDRLRGNRPSPKAADESALAEVLAVADPGPADPAGPDAAGAEPAGPDVAGPEPAGPDVAGPEPGE